MISLDLIFSALLLGDNTILVDGIELGLFDEEEQLQAPSPQAVVWSLPLFATPFIVPRTISGEAQGNWYFYHAGKASGYVSRVRELAGIGIAEVALDVFGAGVGSVTRILTACSSAKLFLGVEGGGSGKVQCELLDLDLETLGLVLAEFDV